MVIAGVIPVVFLVEECKAMYNSMGEVSVEVVACEEQ